MTRRGVAGRVAGLLASIVLVGGCAASVAPSPETSSVLPDTTPVASHLGSSSLGPPSRPTPSPAPSDSATAPSSPSPSLAPTFEPAASVPPLRLPDDVEVTLDEQTYELKGMSEAELLADMKAEKLRDPTTGDHVYALTNWRIKWRYRYAPYSGGCRVTKWTVVVSVEVVMPTWHPPSGASPRLVDHWNRYVQALRLHERRHEQNGLDRAGEAAEYLEQRPTAKTCARLERSIDATIEEFIAAGNAFDRRYDARTDHGATQGVTWP